MGSNRITQLLRYEGTPPFRETFRVVMLLAWPAILEQIMITAVQYIDTAMVGRLGATATAAVGLTSSTIWLFNGLFAAFAIGFSVQVAQYLGAGRDGEAKSVTAQSLRFVTLFGLAMAALALVISGALPNWLRADGAVAPQATAYFRIIALGMPFTLGVNMVSAIFRCAGDTHTPMVLNTTINLINMVLNFFLIYPARTMELFGVDVPVFLLYLRRLFHNPSPVQISRSTSRRLQKSCLRTVLRLSLPVAMERVVMNGAQILITGMISNIGTVATAANHLAVTAESLSYAPAFGVSAAATTLVGQSIGAKRRDLAKRCAWTTTGIGVGIMTLGGLALFTLAEPLLGIFSTDAEVIALGTQVLRIVAFAEPLFGAAIVSGGALRGAGDAKAPFLISLATMWGVRLVLSLVLYRPLGLVGVWIAMAAELVVRGGVFLLRLRGGKWMDLALLGPEPDRQESREV